MARAEDQDGSLLDPQVLRQLFRQLEATDVDELEVVLGESRLYLRREPGRRVPLVRAVDEGQDQPEGAPIVTPLAGVFYSRPAPEQAPFVSLGDQVQPGQVVALIETMKLFNEVTTEIGGTILSVTASDGDLVEMGQALFYVQVQGEQT